MSFKNPKQKELKNILTKELGFTLKSTGASKGTSHRKYIGEYKEKKRIAILPENFDKKPPKIQKQIVSSILKQIGIKKSVFKKFF